MARKNKLRYGSIALIDILGIKGIWAKEETEKLIEKWKSIKQDLLDIKKSITAMPTNNIQPRVYTFSDTIIVVYEGDDPAELLSYMAVHLTYPFCHSLLEKIYLRGAISVGNFYRDSSMVVGPAIDEAAQWYEHYDWMGISLTPSAGFLIDSYVSQSHGSSWYRKYNVPHKNGKDNDIWTLDWPVEFPRVMNQENDTRNPKVALYESFSNPPISPSVKAKYDNTIAYYEYMINNHQEEQRVNLSRTSSI